jgi:hypothetical protein
MRCDFGSFRFSIYIAEISTAAILDHSFLCQSPGTHAQRIPSFFSHPLFLCYDNPGVAWTALVAPYYNASGIHPVGFLPESPLPLESLLHLLCITTLISPTHSTLNRLLSLCAIQHLPLLFQRPQQSSLHHRVSSFGVSLHDFTGQISV